MRMSMREKVAEIMGIVAICLVALLVAGGTVYAIVTAPKEVSRHEFTTNVTVDRTYHRSAYTTPVKTGKTTTYIHHSAENKVYVIYGGEEYMINDRDAYNYCKDKEGKSVQAIMVNIKYDDDTVKCKLLEIITE